MYTYIHIHTYKTATKEKVATTLRRGGGDMGGNGGRECWRDWREESGK